MNFSTSDWERIKNVYSLWWAGKLDRPIIHLTLYGITPNRKEPSIPYRHFTAHYDFSISAEEIVDRWDYNLDCALYLGDAFPSVLPNFGPGVLAAFLGADLIADENTCWFKPKEIQPIQDIHFKLDHNNCWFLRIKEICVAAVKKWQGKVQISMTDLGGSMDVLSTFRPNEHLLFDLYDNPTEVKRLLEEEHNVWWLCFNEINKILQPLNPGYTAWAPIFSAKPYYMLQCDFAYMIGPEMFDEFVLPELCESCKKLTNAFYHLDGIGQLPHLDSLLRIPELKGIQWIPGAGKPPAEDWPDVLRKIHSAGKLIQIYGDLGTLDKLAKFLPSLKGIILMASADVKYEKDAIEILKKYGF